MFVRFLYLMFAIWLLCLPEMPAHGQVERQDEFPSDATKLFPLNPSLDCNELSGQGSKNNSKPAGVQIDNYSQQIKRGCLNRNEMLIQQVPTLGDLEEAGIPIPPDIKNKCSLLFLHVNKLETADQLNDFDVAAYDRDCTFRFQPARDRAASGMSDRIGVLEVVKDGFIHCTGIIRDEQTVITALHCLKDPSLGSKKRLSTSDLSFIRLSEPGKRIPIVHFTYPPRSDIETFLSGGSLDQSNDIVVMHLAWPLNISKSSGVTFGPRKGIDAFRVVGFDSLIAYQGADFSTQRIRSVLASWPAFLREDGAALCRIDRAEGPNGLCLVHSCPTFHGMSGAPLFEIDSRTGAINVFAIHSGALTEYSCHPRQRRAIDRSRDNAFPNVANRVNQAWIENAR